MDIHNYDMKTGEYLSTITATLDPIDKQPLIPAHATNVNLPILVSNEVAVFNINNNTWDIVSDNRVQVYNTTTQEQTKYTKLGKLPTNLTKVKPLTKFDVWSGTTWVFNLDEAKQDKLNLIKQLRNTAIYQPIDSSALGTIHTYSITEKNNSFLNNLITLGNGSKFTCIDISGTKARIFHTDTQLRTLGLDIETHTSTQFDKYELKLIEVEAATSQVELDAITW